jgi:hypothetical protein
LCNSTVAKYMVRADKPPSQTWRMFLANHAQDIAVCDFFTVPTATFRMLYCFVVIRHDSRRVVHFNVTNHPTARWTAQRRFETVCDYLQSGEIAVRSSGVKDFFAKANDSVSFLSIRRLRVRFPSASLNISPKNPMFTRVCGFFRARLAKSIDHPLWSVLVCFPPR